MPTLEPALDEIRRDLAALNSAARKEPPTWEEVQAALAKLRADLSSFITGMRQLNGLEEYAPNGLPQEV